MDRTISSVLTLTAIGLALLFAPFMLRSCVSPGGSASAATSPKEESAKSADDSFDDEEEGFQPAATATYGTLTQRQVRMYIEVRRRARALRDELIARHQPTDGAAAKAADELGFDSEEYESVRRKIDSVLRLEANTPEERERLSRDWGTLNGLREDLKSVGVLVPTSEAMTAAVYPASERTIRTVAEPWGPQAKAIEEDRKEALRKARQRVNSPYAESLRQRETNETSTVGYGATEAENQRRLQQWIDQSRKQDGQ